MSNYSEVIELIRKMEEALPIPVYPAKAFVLLMREKGLKIKSKREVLIEKVFYLGDEGGIMCAVKNPGKEAIVVSLTHLRVKANHPLAKDCRRSHYSTKISQIDPTVKLGFFSFIFDKKPFNNR